jgi:transcriptional regulator with XRE-family HTH domain
MSEPTPDTLAERLSTARKERGLTQAQLAKLANLSQSTIGNLEAGLRKEPRDILRIAEALRISPDWLQSGTGTKEPAPITKREDIRSLLADLELLHPEQIARLQALVRSIFLPR